MAIKETKIVTLFDDSAKEIALAPRTKIEAISDLNGTGLDAILNTKISKEDTVGRNTTGTEYNINDESVIAGVGAEIFNNYALNKASGEYSHAEGLTTIASGEASHAEGASTTASGKYSHAEGNKTTAFGKSAHAEGESYKKLPSNITSSSSNNIIITEWESNRFTLAKGDYSHAEGWNTLALGRSAHTEGQNTIASGINAHAEGADTKATNQQAHAEGYHTEASAMASHAEGQETTASGYYSHAEGNDTTASGNSSHSEGYKSTASGDRSHAEGERTTASGKYSHAEGNSTTASGNGSHAEGNSTTASGSYSHSEGYSTYALGSYSHAEGQSSNSAPSDITSSSTNDQIITKWNTIRFTLAKGSNSHAEGNDTLALGNSSHAEGKETIAVGDYQHVQGKYNITDTANKYAHIVGNGTSNYAKSNAHTVDWDGNAWYQGNVDASNFNALNAIRIGNGIMTYDSSNNRIVISFEN